MNHSRPLGLAGVRDSSSPPQKSVHQRPGPVAGCRVNHHSGRLVHHKKGLVLEDDADRNVFTGDRPFLDFGYLHADCVARLGSVARLFTLAADQDVSLRNQGRCLRPRKLGMLGNKEVEADIAVRLDWKLSGVAQKLIPRSEYPTREQRLRQAIAPRPREPTRAGRRQC